MDTNYIQSNSFCGETLLPEVLRKAPNTRPIFDRYGLQGCGGNDGPFESLAFFARAHDVPLEKLLRELHEVMTEPSVLSADSHHLPATLADRIYQPFFKGGIAVVLTLGAVWGAYLLIRIALMGSFTAVGIHEVNAHGHAQIFGWVGLFVMGFAYQAFPRFKHTSLAHPRWAMASFLLMLTGLVARSLAQAFLPGPGILVVIGLAGSALELLAIGIFIVVIWDTILNSEKRTAVYDAFIFSALFWFVIQAQYEMVYFAATALAPSREALLELVAVWQAPLRDIQIHGFALLMILGVSQRIFPYFYDLPKPSPVRAKYLLMFLNLAVLGEVLGLILMRTAGHAWMPLWYLSVILLSISVFLLVKDWRIFSRATDIDRSLKFLRTAYGWLFLSLGMLVLLPVYQLVLLRAFAPDSAAAQLGFSHAYYGAIRHAITVGFVSMMIVGVAAKVTPTLKGVDVHSLSGLWLPYVLLNAGCAMRVGFQTLTDFTEQAFYLAGLSGMLEVSALAIWGIHLWGIMNRNSAEAAQGRPVDAPALENGMLILGGHRVSDVLALNPGMLKTFLDFGFTPLANPILRRTLAPRITVAGAARRLGVDLDSFLKALNAARERHEHEVPADSNTHWMNRGAVARG